MLTISASTMVPKMLPYQEKIIYYVRTGVDTFTAVNVERARRKKIDKQEEGLDPDILIKADLIWQVQYEYILLEPLVDDNLVDSSGTKWIVLEVIEKFNGKIYNLFCMRSV